MKCDRCGTDTKNEILRWKTFGEGKCVNLCEHCALQFDVVMTETFERLMACELPQIRKQENGETTVSYL